LEHRISKKVRRSNGVQISLHLLGFAMMLIAYLLIIPYLDIADANTIQTDAYTYLTIAPILFVFGLCIFVLPCFWQG